MALKGNQIMYEIRIRAHACLPAIRPGAFGAALTAAALVLVLSFAAGAQEPAPAATPQPDQSAQPAVAAPVAAAEPATAQAATPAEAAADAAQPGGITEDQLKQMAVGKTFYLRGGYLDDSLSFNEHGGLSGHSAQGSFTLNMVEIDKVRLTKHKVELEGLRYGLHFLGELPYEDPANAMDKVRITPKKKVLKISIDRELVVKPKKVKEVKPGKKAAGKGGPAAAALATAPTSVAESAATPASEAAAPASASPEDAATTPAAAAAPAEMTDEAEAKAEMATAPEAERPADPGSVTTTLSPAHATEVLKDALDKIFAPGMDDRLKASMPEFWKLYYQAAAAKTDYRPSDPAVLRQSNVDRKARLLSTFEPKSNQYAQDNGVAGMALYHAVIGADGKPGEIAVARPIGFGLDENAVEAIRNAKFEPAMKDGKPVPVLLDLVVQFRIYSKRTEAVAAPEPADKPAEPVLPGPYSVHHQ